MKKQKGWTSREKEDIAIQMFFDIVWQTYGDDIKKEFKKFHNRKDKLIRAYLKSKEDKEKDRKKEILVNP